MGHDNVMELIRFLGERSGEGVVLFEQGGETVGMNATARRLLNLWRREDAPSLPLVCDRLGIRSSEIFNLEGGGVPWCANLFGKLVEVHLFGFQTEGTLLRRTVALLRDIEREKEIEQARNEFLVLLSQELRNPIEALRGVVETLREGLLGEASDQQKEFLEVIGLQMDGVAEFVVNLLDFSSVLVGGYRFRRRSLEIREVLNRTKLKVAGIAKARAVRLSMEVGKNIPKFYGDEQRIEQALTAITAAAVRMRAKGGSVELRATMDSALRAGNPVPGGALLVTIRVGNIGITKASADQVITRPAATEMVAARECGGFGLALLVGKSVVLGHGGKIWADGQKGMLQSVNLLIPMDLRRARAKRPDEADAEKAEA